MAEDFYAGIGGRSECEGQVVGLLTGKHYLKCSQKGVLDKVADRLAWDLEFS